MNAFQTPRLPLSLALLGVQSAEIGDDPRSQIAWAGAAGFNAVQLNATAPTVRPRELDRSARRDLAAILRRHDLASSGIDLFIPPTHLTDHAHVDRAIAAITGAIELAAQLADLTAGAPVLSTELPHDPLAKSALDTIAEHALSHGVRLADHTWPPDDARPTGSPIGVGVDPATLFFTDSAADPPSAVSSLKGDLVSARLSDIAASGRVAPGDGRLDELAYAVALATGAHRGFLVVDLRGLRRQAATARDAIARLGRTNDSTA